MPNKLVKVDDLPTSGFHKRIAFVAAGGPFCDGYLLGIIAVALPFLVKDLHLTASQSGLIGAAALLGMMVGGVLLGPATDKFGRQIMYLLNLAVFVLCSIAHLFVTDVTTLFLLRFIMGIAIGADYPIATALASEFLPRNLRGPILSSLVLFLWAGYIASLCVGFFVSGIAADSWRYILASSAIPAALFLVLRLNVPESPRWLISAGKADEARKVVSDYLGPDVDFEQLLHTTPRRGVSAGIGLSSIRDIFTRGYGRNVVFCSIFWMCQIAPSFAIKTFQPLLLSSFGITQAIGASLLITSFAVLGTALGMFTINKVGRRRLLITSYIASTAALFLLATPLSAMTTVVLLCFIFFTISEAAGSSLQFVYPNELFPTDIRATGMGLAVAASRIGAAAGTFVLPLSISFYGATYGLFIAAFISAVGLIVSYLMAPETTGMQLEPAMHLDGNASVGAINEV